MRRRVLLASLGGAASLWRSASPRAEPKAVPLVGLLSSGSPDAYTEALDSFHKGLMAEGWKEGHDIAIEYRWAEGHYEREAAMAAELVTHYPDVIAALSSAAAFAAKAATSTVPIVFYSAADPVESGLVKSLARPGGNMTGISAFFTKLAPKRVQLLHELLPEAKTLGLIVNPAFMTTAGQLAEVGEAVRGTGLALEIANASTAEELDRAFAGLAGRKVDGLILGGDPFYAIRLSQIVGLAARHRLPAIYADERYVAQGGLMSYGDSLVHTWRQAGIYTGKVLNGARPADLPVAQPTEFELMINLATARALGITVPPILLGRASKVIE